MLPGLEDSSGNKTVLLPLTPIEAADRTERERIGIPGGGSAGRDSGTGRRRRGRF